MVARAYSQAAHIGRVLSPCANHRSPLPCKPARRRDRRCVL